MNAIATVPWVYPTLESAHICGVGLLLGSLAVFELRVWGRAPSIDNRALARLALPVTLAGFGLAVASGVVMFAAAPAEMLGNNVFVAKMCLVLVAGLNALWFHERGALAAADGLARAQAALSLGLWVAVIFCGRWIAYR